MKIHNPILIFLVFCTLLLTNVTCKKDPTKNAVLPPATQEGKNTVGFLINDEVWVPYAKCGGSLAGSGSSSACGKINVQYDDLLYGGSMSFQCSRRKEKSGKTSSLTISSSVTFSISSVGNKIDSIGAHFQGENSNGNEDNYSRLQNGSKFIITKLDKVNRIVSGEFELILGEDNGSGKQITLKSGRFDFKMNSCICD